MTPVGIEALGARVRELERMNDFLMERNHELAHENALLRGKAGDQKESSLEGAWNESINGVQMAYGWPGSFLGF